MSPHMQGAAAELFARSAELCAHLAELRAQSTCSLRMHYAS